MNRIYKLKFDKRRNELVIVSEITAGAGKEKSTGHIADLSALPPFRKLPGRLTPVALLTGLISGLLPAMVLAADLPTGGQIVGGQGSISTSGSQMTIHQQTQNMATNWHSFDIGKNNTVQFVQPDSSSVALNRVTGASGSQIMGTLKANGRVFILNPNGVLFGKGARVNVGGLVASTKHLSTADFMKGQYTLSGSGNPGAQVVNQGSLTTSKGGYIVLAGERVSNSGTVTTPSGKTVLAAGKTVTLQLDNGGLTSVSVNGSVVNALVENRGLISATDGQVYLTAKGQDMLLKTVVNNSGTVEAKGLASRGGEIVLNGGDSGVVSQSGLLLADSQTGQGGKITLEGQNIHLEGRSLTSATGKAGGGEVYAGGGWQGKDSGIRNASKVVMDKAATVDVSATENGNGGTAVLWSEDYTNFRGTVLAKGGARSGNGGKVETSSHQNLQASGDVDASARAGRGGEWLLDPTDVNIVGTGSETGIDSAIADGTDIFTPTAAGAQILNTSIVSQLNAGTNVTVKTSGADTAGQAGNITVNANIIKSAGVDAKLTLLADNKIATANGTTIGASAGKLDLNLLAGNSVPNSNIVLGNGINISLNGGDFYAGAADSSGNVSMTYQNNGQIRAGNITMDLGRGLSGYAYGVLADNNLTINGPVSGSTGWGVPLQFTAGDLLTINSPTFITLTATDTSHSGGKIIIRGNNGVNLTTDSGNINLQAASASTNSVNISSSNGAVSIVAGGNLSLSYGDVSSGSGKDITLLGAGSSTGMITVQNINLTSNGGNITLNQKDHTSTGSDGTDITNPNAMTVKVDASVLNASSANGTAGNVSLYAFNPNIDLGQTAYINTVRNGGAALQVSGNSQVTANDITLTTTLSGANGYALPIFLYGANLNAQHDISLKGMHSGGTRSSALELRGDANTLLAGGNIAISDSQEGDSNAVFLNGVNGTSSLTAGQDIILNGTTQGGSGVKVQGVKLTAGNDINATGTAVSGSGLSVSNATLNATGALSLTGNTTSGAGVMVSGSTINGARAAISAASASGATGFSITGSTLGGALSDLTNVTLSSAGSGGGVTNMLDSSVVNDTNRDVLLAKKIENMTTVDMNGSAIFNNASAGWHADYSSEDRPYAGWIFNHTSVTAGGDVSVSGVGLTNSTVSVSNGTLAINNAGAVQLTGTNITVSGGDVSVHAGAGNVDLSQGAVSVSGGGLTINASGASAGNVLAANAAMNVSGDIAINAYNGINLTSVSVTKTSPADANMTMTSGGGMTIDGSIVSNSGKLNLNVLAGNKTNNATVTLGNNISINLNGGDVYVGAGDPSNNISMKFSNNGQIRAGNITMDLTRGLSGYAYGVLADNNLTINGPVSGSTGWGVPLQFTAGDLLTINSPTFINLTAPDSSHSGGRVIISGNNGVNLTSVSGGINLQAATAATNSVNISSSNGSINITGFSRNSSGVYLENTNLTSMNMNISGESYGLDSMFGVFGGVQIFKNASFTVGGSGSIRGRSHTTAYVNDKTFAEAKGYSAGIHMGGAFRGSGAPTNINFNGDFDLMGEQYDSLDANNTRAREGASGVMWDGVVNLDVANGNLNITGIGDGHIAGIRQIGSSYDWQENDVFKLNNANVNINALASDGSAIVLKEITLTRGFIFSGNGNVAVSAHNNSTGNASLDLNMLNNTNFNGSLTVDATNDSGDGIIMDGRVNSNVVNATISGHSGGSGSGVVINASSTVLASLGNNTISGDSVSGTGIQVRGNKVTITNGTLNGTSASGNGSGVVLIGGSNYTLDGANITGSAVNGAGVAVSGSLTVNNGASVVGQATGAGSGIQVSGNLSTSAGDGISLAGTASSGDGIVVNGNASLTNASLSGQSDSGSGVNIRANLTTDSTTTVVGSAQTGTGVNLGAALTGATVNGTSLNGIGVQLADNAVVKNASLAGASTNGDGVAVTGHISLDDTTAQHLNASSVNGTGLSLQDNANVSIVETNTGLPVTAPVELAGTSENGSGIASEGNVSISGIVLNGTTDSDNGVGVTLGGNLTIGDAISGVTASSSGNGTALVLNNATVNASAYADAGKDFTLNASASGEGDAIHTVGANTLNSVVLNGTTAGNGTAVTVNGTLATDKEIIATSQGANGTGLVLSGGELTSTTPDGTPVNVTVSASGKGTAVEVASGGNSTLNNISLNASADTGPTLSVAGNLTSNVNLTVSTSNSTAIELNGGKIQSADNQPPITINASATGDSGTAVHVTAGSNSGLSDVVLNTSATQGDALKVEGVLSTQGSDINANVTGTGTALNVSGGTVNSAGNTTLNASADKGQATVIHNGTLTSTTPGGLTVTSTTQTDSPALNISGNSEVTNSQVSGENSGHGSAVQVSGNLTSNGGGEVTGQSTDGVGVTVADGTTIA
ncbi:hypothetical protein DRT26_20350, partial [Salmonella enterica subsp. enterica serovar Oranienburg]|nr:hypothetical protein [Salmonella enterica subsp. enterica serovar Oranienburg]